MIFVPEIVVNKARAHGVGAWVDELPGLIAHEIEMQPIARQMLAAADAVALNAG